MSAPLTERENRRMAGLRAATGPFYTTDTEIPVVERMNSSVDDLQKFLRRETGAILPDELLMMLQYPQLKWTKMHTPNDTLTLFFGINPQSDRRDIALNALGTVLIDSAGQDSVINVAGVTRVTDGSKHILGITYEDAYRGFSHSGFCISMAPNEISQPSTVIYSHDENTLLIPPFINKNGAQYPDISGLITPEMQAATADATGQIHKRVVQYTDEQPRRGFPHLRINHNPAIAESSALNAIYKAKFTTVRYTNPWDEESWSILIPRKFQKSRRS